MLWYVLVYILLLSTPYDNVIKSEWKVAQDYLAMAADIGDKAYTIKSECCVFEPVRGTFKGETNYYKGELNGYLYLQEDNGVWRPHIKWNTDINMALRHEAAHYILYKLEHRCFAAFSLDYDTVYYHTFYPKIEFCKKWIDMYWGKGQRPAEKEVKNE